MKKILLEKETKKSSIRELFTTDYYEVPSYQRGYSWDSKDIENLLNDISDCRSKNEEYFFGTIFLTKRKSNLKHIVDGQQRITTIIILLCSLRELVEELEIKELKTTYDELERHTFRIERGVKRSLIKMNNIDSDFIEKIVLNKTSKGPKYTSQKSMKYAYDFYIKDINTRIKAYSHSEKIDYIKDVVSTILDKLVVICAVAKDEIDVHRIFETMNDRGIKLSDADLLKNYLFSLASENDISTFIDKWAEIVKNLNSINFDKFLRHYWIAKHEIISQSQTYKAFKGSIVKSSAKAKTTINALNISSEYYKNLRNPDEEFWGKNKTIIKLIKDLKNLKVEQPLIYFLIAGEKYNNPDGQRYLEKAFELIVNFSFIYNTICKQPANVLEKTFADLAHEEREGKLTIGKLKGKLIAILPGEDLFREKFLAYKTSNSKLSKYILYEINNYLLEDLEINTKKDNLEHVIPKKWEESWGSFLKDKIKDWNTNHATSAEQRIDIKKDNDVREKIIDLLGNHTILLDSDNTKASNNAFAEKKNI